MSWAAVIAGGVSLAGAALSSSATGNAAGQQNAATEGAIHSQNVALQQARSDLSPYRQAGNAALSRLQTLLGIGGPGDIMLPNGMTATDLARQQEDQFLKQYGPAAQSSTSVEQYEGIDPTGAQKDINARIPDILKQFGIDPNTVPSNSGDLLKSFAPSDLAADPIYKDALDFSTQQGEKAINQRAAATGSYDSGAALKALTKFNQGNVTQYGNDAFNRWNTDNTNTFNRLNSLVGTGASAAGNTANAALGTGNNISNLQSAQGNANAASTIAGGNAMSSGANSVAGGINNYSLLQQLTGGGARATTPVGGYTPTYPASQLPG